MTDVDWKSSVRPLHNGWVSFVQIICMKKYFVNCWLWRGVFTQDAKMAVHFSEFHTANKCIIQSRWLCRADVKSLRSTTLMADGLSRVSQHQRLSHWRPQLLTEELRLSYSVAKSFRMSRPNFFFLLISFPVFVLQICVDVKSFDLDVSYFHVVYWSLQVVFASLCPPVTQPHLCQVCPAECHHLLLRQPLSLLPAHLPHLVSVPARVWHLPLFFGAYQIVSFASRLSAPVLPSIGDLTSLYVHLLLHTEWVHHYLSR